MKKWDDLSIQEFTASEVGEILSVTQERLRAMRKRKGGPACFKRGNRIYYTRHTIQEWLDRKKNVKTLLDVAALSLSESQRAKEIDEMILTFRCLRDSEEYLLNEASPEGLKFTLKYILALLAGDIDKAFDRDDEKHVNKISDLYNDIMELMIRDIKRFKGA